MPAMQAPCTPGTPRKNSSQANVDTVESPVDLPPEPAKDIVALAKQSRMLLKLPANEVFVADCYAALKVQGIYVAGSLYMFESYVGFHSTSFGTTITRLISLKMVQAIRRRQHFSQPNALEIKYVSRSSGAIKYVILANLADREGVLQSLLTLWERACPASYEYFQNNLHMQQTWREKKFKKITDLVRLRPGGDDADDAATLQGDSEQLDRAETLEADAEGQDDAVDSWMQQWLKALGDVNACPEDSPSDVPSDAQVVGEGTLPATVQDYVQHIHFSSYMKHFQEQQHSTGISLSTWWPVGDNPLQLARQMEWVTHKKNRFGPTTIQCYQSQRLSIYNGQHVTFETEMNMPAVPYGDFFKCCSRWDIQPSPAGLSWRQVAWVKLLKDTVFKRQIQSGVLGSMRDSSAMQLEAMSKEIQRAKAAATTPDTVTDKVERSLQSLFRRVPSAARPDVYALVQARIESQTGQVHKKVPGSSKSSTHQQHSIAVPMSPTMQCAVLVGMCLLGLLQLYTIHGLNLLQAAPCMQCAT